MRVRLRGVVARLGSPLFFVLAGLCFLLPFTTVSCGAAPFQAVTSSGSSAGVTPNSGANLVERSCDMYSGINLVSGGAPSVYYSPQGGCGLFPPANQNGSPATADTGGVPLGPQPLMLLVLAAILVGLVASLTRRVSRVTILAATAIMAILLQWLWECTEIGMYTLGGYRVNLGIGAILCMAALALAALSYRVSQRWAPTLVHAPPAGANARLRALFGGQPAPWVPPPPPEPPWPPTPAP